jgi:hypothetical protein
MVMLYGANKGIAWQKAWLLTTILNVLIDIFFNYFCEGFILHFWIPSLISDQVHKVGISLKKLIGVLFSDEFKNSKTKHKFSSTEYMFLSHMLALNMPELHESALIMSYKNALPLNELSEIADTPEAIREKVIQDALHFMSAHDPRSAEVKRYVKWQLWINSMK